MMFVYSLYDVVLQENMPIFQAKNDDVAIRDYYSMMKNPNVNSKDFLLLRHFELLDTESVRLDFRPAYEDITPEVKDVSSI